MSTKLPADYSTYFVECNEVTTHCQGVSEPHKHCTLCAKMFNSKYRCERHFAQSHASRAVVVKDQLCFPCRLLHNAKGCERAHYHCPVCNRTVLNRVRFAKHIEMHRNRCAPNKTPPNCNEAPTNETAAPISNDTPPTREATSGDSNVALKDETAAPIPKDTPPTSDATSGNSNVAPTNETASPISKQTPTSEATLFVSRQSENAKRNLIDTDESSDELSAKRRRKGKKACQICGKEMDPRSIQRHLRDIHGEEVPKSVCVDEARGIFMIRKSSKGGVAYPIHVQKSVAGPEPMKPFCEDDRCRIYMDIAWRSGMSAVECRHLQQVGNGSEYKQAVKLSESCLLDLSPHGPYKLLKNESIQDCLSLAESASSNNAEVIVSYPDGEHFIHFSVYDGDVHYYSKLGRVVVSCNLTSGILDCACCRRKRGCVHKAICLWYLSSEGMLHNIIPDVANANLFQDNQENDDFHTSEMLNFPSSRTNANENQLIYPPDDEKVVSQMCRYLRSNKRIPLDATRDKTKPLLNRLEPVEKDCAFCHVPLTNPILITNNASIMTMDRTLSGVKTFYRKCEKCQACYRYQEFSDGLHNFNDRLILGLDVCRFLRESLQNHIPLGSILQVLESTLETKLHLQTVVNAYLHFDALSAHEYKFYCSICGYYPHTLIFDLNRKVAFQCSAESLRLPENYVQENEANDVVDSDEFWSNVELTMIARGYPGTAVREFDTKPDLLKWAPFIGERSRTSHMLINTEHKKIRQEDGKLEQDCREVTEERLLEMLHQSSQREIRGFAKQLGLSGSGSKLDIIMAIKRAVGIDTEKFKKAFGKLWGCSGGWASGTCPHGVVYALKFVLRSESPRDYVDLLLSIKFQPNVVIVDVANLVAAHGNKRKENMFHPYNGKVVNPTTENVTKAKTGKLEVSFDWLDTGTKQPNSSTKDTAHPVTGSSVRLCLFDRLHEKNVKREEEILRRVTQVKQLNGLLNTQRQEQLNNMYNKDSRFLNSMKPVNHIFLFRSNIDFHNEKLNRRNLENIRTATKHEIGQDSSGRIMIDKTRKSSHRLEPAHEVLQNTFSTQPVSQLPSELIVNPSGTNPQIEHPIPASSTNLDSPDIGSSPESVISEEPPFSSFSSRPPNASCEVHVSPDPNAKDFPPTAAASVFSGTCTNISGSTADMPVVVVDDSTPERYDIENPVWIAELGLHYSDKKILEDGHWLTDRIILAVFKLLRRDSRTRNLAGLEDVIPASRYGFTNPGALERFVQIVNVRGNHWIVMSNIRSSRDEVVVYDSYVALNRKKDAVSYPMNVDLCACNFIKPVGFVRMYVGNVQQQRGGAACGLFASANTIALCFGKDPLLLKFKQESLAPALIECFVTRDITTFLSRTSKPRDLPMLKFLYEWDCWVYCHCNMPDDGKLMASCKKCQRWFHADCEQGDFKNPNWLCMNCERRKEEARQRAEVKKTELERELKTLNDVRKVASRHSDGETLTLLYDLINNDVLGKELPPGNETCGFLNCKEFDDIAKTPTSRHNPTKLGQTMMIGNHLYIAIFAERHKNQIHIFKTLVHEIVHAVHIRRKLKGSAHGKEFMKVGKEVLAKLRKKLSTFPEPYCHVVLNDKEILPMRSG